MRISTQAQRKKLVNDVKKFNRVILGVRADAELIPLAVLLFFQVCEGVYSRHGQGYNSLC